MSNIAYVGASIDGFIADRDGGLDFLSIVPNPDEHDFGFADFMGAVDALLMGRKTFEVVLSFGVGWPYSRPVFVLSSTLRDVSEPLKGKVEIVSGQLVDVVAELNERGFHNLYVDGGKLVQSFLEQGMLDEMIITRVPVVLGGGTSLFGALPAHVEFEHVRTEVFLDALVQSHYKKKVS